eukprot:TRINITY_DN2725_c0_g1_i1.p1 TRINITY_DN2725_c0_g1~~TRINITY_DN2725_c0_g1_i1.p1  ORF type:complete len:369 (+),score=90.97 TRINITY_DN2725_c0_g1_i1:75-1181(+)
MSGKPRVLVLGGLGFIGRNLVKYLVENDLASKIRVADKTMIAMVRLGKDFTDAFDKVEVIQVNLINPDGAAKAFTDPEGDYTIVFNLASETKLAQQENVYAEGITKLEKTVTDEAAKHKTEKYITVSTAEVYEASSKPRDESASLKPWRAIGKAKLAAEEHVRANKNVPAIIVRPSTVYGPGDTKQISFAACTAAIWKKKAETMEVANWYPDLKVSTVHIHDVVRALWHLAANGKPGDVYNLADKTDTDQGTIYKTLEKIMPGFTFANAGVIQSEALKLMSLDTLIDYCNNLLTPIWLKISAEHKLEFSPISPFTYGEYVENKSISIDGSAIEKTGFKYEHPKFGEAELREQLNKAVAEGWFPPNVVA